MERSNFWTFLCLGLAVGIALEIMKSPAGKTNVRLAGFTRFETLLAEGRQVYVPSENEKKRAAKVTEEKIVPHQLSPDELPPSDQLTAAKPPTAKVETPEEKKKREEAEKKKKLLEKKKRLKAKRKAKAEAERKAREAAEKDKEEKAPEESVEENPPMAPYTTYLGLPGEAESDDPQTAAEWEAYLMKSVDHERMNHFIERYQSGKVTAEVFYTVINAMLEDHRPEMHSLALSGLSATPSQASFDRLLSVSKSDPFQKIRSEAAVYLDNYGRLENLRFLVNVISTSKNQDSVLHAIQLVRLSAQSTLKKRPTPSPGGPTTQNVRQMSAQTLARYYQPFVPALTTTSQRGPSETVRSSARGAVQELQSLLSTITQQQPLQQPST